MPMRCVLAYFIAADGFEDLDSIMSKPASTDLGDFMHPKTELPENHLLSKLESLHAKLKRHQARRMLPMRLSSATRAPLPRVRNTAVGPASPHDPFGRKDVTRAGGIGRRRRL
jgi:hypothetical protein